MSETVMLGHLRTQDEQQFGLTLPNLERLDRQPAAEARMRNRDLTHVFQRLCWAGKTINGHLRFP